MEPEVTRQDIQAAMPERILCAAIHFDDGQQYANQPHGVATGIVLCGFRHHNIFSQIGGLVGERIAAGINKETQGFLTNKNRFVDRKVAAEIATAQKQLMPPKASVKTLYSEDLY